MAKRETKVAKMGQEGPILSSFHSQQSSPQVQS